ncbi:MAG: hypothetical protein RL083_2145, partial [Pseudomonadota bacterium]
KGKVKKQIQALRQNVVTDLIVADGLLIVCIFRASRICLINEF